MHQRNSASPEPLTFSRTGKQLPAELERTTWAEERGRVSLAASPMPSDYEITAGYIISIFGA